MRVKFTSWARRPAADEPVLAREEVVDLAPLHEDLVQHIPVACVPKLLIKTSTRVARSVLQKKAEGPDSAMRT